MLSITWRARLLSGLLSSLTLIALVLLAQSRIRAVLFGAVDDALRKQAQGLLRDPRFAQPPQGWMPGPGMAGEPLDGPGPPRRGRGGPPPLQFGTTTLLRPRRIPLERDPSDDRPEPSRWSSAGFEAAKLHGEDLRDELAPDGSHRRILSLRGPGAVIQAASQLDGTEGALREIQAALYRLLLPLALGSFVLGALLTELVLAPVRRLARAAASIAPENLAARLPAPGGRDAFDGLVGALNAMLARLDDAFVRQKRFTADASHELRTPLSVIKATTSFLLEGDTLSESQRRALSRADATADRANQLVTDLLLLARTENGTLTPRPETVALDSLLREIAADAEATYLAPHAPVVLIVRDGAALATDPELLRRLVGNLLSNALRHTPTNGEVTLRFSENTLTVADTGEGIPGEALARIGEPFFRPDDARARTHGGAGLGLALCKEIARSLGATLEIQSEIERGTAVTVRFREF